MGIRISSLGKDSSFRDDDYLLKDGDTSGTRLISIQNAADDIARKSTVVIKRASNYDEATTITETDYIIKDNTTAPARVSATNAASSFVQLASYPDDTNVEEEDYILKVGADGSTSKVPAVQAGSDLAIFGGQIAGAEMLEEAIARGIVDQAMTNAIQTTVPQAVTQLRVELSEGSAATQIVDGALTAYSQAVAIAETDKFYKRDVDDTETTYVSAEQIFDAGVVVSSRVKNDCQTPDTDSGYVLDARQGRVLNAVKIDKTSIADNLTTDDATKVLSAKQGKNLKDLVDDLDDNKVDITVPSIAVNVNASATTDDGKLTTALTALGWNSDIIDGLLNLKSWMTKVNNLSKTLANRGGFSGAVSLEYHPTYVSNPFFSETAVGRLIIYRTGARSGMVRVNLSNDLAQMPHTTTTTHIATLPSGAGVNRDVYAIIPAQNTSGAALYFQITASDSKITVANLGSTTIPKSDFCRTCLPLALAYYAE